MRRPEARVLPDAALIPDENLLKPAPSHFTHRLRRAQPFWFGTARSGAPAGVLPAKTPVQLVAHDGGAHCRVADAHGLCVDVEYASLAPLARPGRERA